MARILGRLCVGLVALAVAASFLGRVHPAGDSLAVIRYPLAMLLLVLALLARRWGPARGLAVVAVVLLAGRGLMLRDPGAEVVPQYVLYQKNLLFRRADRTDFIADVRASGADFVTLEEVSRANRPLLDVFKEDYPYQLFCTGTRVGAVAVLSRWPIIDSACSDPAGIALAEVEGPDGPLRVVALHLQWPWPHAQMEHLEEILPVLEGRVPMRTILGGDFNMVPWGASLDMVGDALGIERIGPVHRTFEVRHFPITIDHVLAGPGARGTAEVRPRMGSDHFGVLARVAFDG